MKRPDEKLLALQRQGHRERLRQRFLKDDISALQDYEILEYLLGMLIPRRDVKPIAKALIEKFNGFTGVLDAPVHELEKFGLTSRVAADLAFLRSVITFFQYEKVAERPFLENSEAAVRYLQAKLGSCTKETLMVLYLDSGRKILGIWEHAGTVNSASVAPREVVERALIYHAAGVIMVHNHPSGSCKPSAADIEFTRSMYNALEIFGIPLLDHLIVTKGSFRSLMK
jgi:DNA repair protein RadC